MFGACVHIAIYYISRANIATFPPILSVALMKKKKKEKKKNFRETPNYLFSYIKSMIEDLHFNHTKACRQADGVLI